MGKARQLKVVSDSDALNGDDSLQLRVFAILTQLWIRLGNESMAIQSCLRGLTWWCGCGDDITDVVRLVCCLARLVAQTTPTRIDAARTFLQHVRGQYQCRLGADQDTQLLVAINELDASQLLFEGKPSGALARIACALERLGSTGYGGEPHDVLGIRLLHAQALFVAGCQEAAVNEVAAVSSVAERCGLTDVVATARQREAEYTSGSARPTDNTKCGLFPDGVTALV